MKRRFVDEDLKKKIRALDAKGKQRSEIAKELDVAPSTVTKVLGPIRDYRFPRAQLA